MAGPTRTSTCPICLQGLASGEETSALLCGHSFHLYCLNTYSETTNTPISELACPTCKCTAVDIANMSKLKADIPESLGGLRRTCSSSSAELHGDTAADSHEATSVAPQAKAPQAEAQQAGASEAPQAEAPQAEAPQATEAPQAEASRAGASQAVAVPHPFFLSPKVWCSNCGNQVEVSKCRLLSKRAGTWRCPCCCTKITQLWRGFGEWPIPAFASLSEEAQHAFFRDSHGAGKDIVRKCDQLLQQHENHERWYSCGGKFLPLSVWGVKGWDTDRIAQNSTPEDIAHCAVGGTTYRVPIRAAGERGEQGIRSLATARKKPRISAARPSAAIAAAAGLQKQQEHEQEEQQEEEEQEQTAAESDQDKGSSSSNSSDSESSSSSSSSEDKKKKKKNKKKAAKQSKKEKHRKESKKKKVAKKKAAAKEREKKEKAAANERTKLEAAAKKALDKQHAAKKSLAQQVLKKVSPTVLSLGMVLCNPATLSIPMAVNQGQCILHELQDLEKLAKLVLEQPTTEMPIPSITDVTPKITAAKRTEALILGMISSIDKMPSFTI